MKTKFLLALVIVAIACSASYARHDEQYVIEEASRRGIKLISQQEVMDIAIKSFKPDEVFIRDFDLDDHYKDSAEFRPIYELECVSRGRKYDMDIDAVTGEVLKFKLDH
ncbi:MAG: PepSY domain-containing protein [Synergistaceae bacterium]|nr:PepSY domain-containing protein [Synergistaceae bacterium]